MEGNVPFFGLLSELLISSKCLDRMLTYLRCSPTWWWYSLEPPHDITNKMTVHPAKTQQISLGIHPVWSESSQCAQWVAKNPMFLHADSKDPDQTGQMPRLIWVFAWHSCHFVIPNHTKSGGVLCHSDIDETLMTVSPRPVTEPKTKFFHCSTCFFCGKVFPSKVHFIPSEWVSIRPWSIPLSVSASFPCSNFSTFWPIFFKLCIDIGMGEQRYGIASGLISFWNNRVMALDVCQKCFVLRFRALTLVLFTDFLQTLHRHWYQRGGVWDYKWDNFIQKQQSYGPLFMFRMHFWSIA